MSEIPPPFGRFAQTVAQSPSDRRRQAVVAKTDTGALSEPETLRIPERSVPACRVLHASAESAGLFER
jgi:hypothetical protein